MGSCGPCSSEVILVFPRALGVVGAELLGRLCYVLCVPVSPVLHSPTCDLLQESPCDLFQFQGLMKVPALSRNPLWHR